MNDRPDHRTLTDAEWESLARAFAEESDAAEAADVNALLAENPSLAAELDALRQALGEPGRLPSGVDVEAALRQVHARIDAEDPSIIPIDSRLGARVVGDADDAPRGEGGRGDEGGSVKGPHIAPARPGHWWHARWVRAAAGVAIVLGAALVWRTATLDAPPLMGLEFATAVGEQTAFDLPDGTSVVLGPSSRLAVGEDYGTASRTVDLAGEAYFVATHDASRPFRVRAGGAVVEDLGTAFLVRAVGATSPQGVDRLRVVVTEGSVRFEPPGSGEPVVLSAGDRAVLGVTGDVVAERGVDVGAEVAWTEGTLTFEDAPLDRVAADVLRWYGLVLRFDSALAQRRLTAAFESDAREDVLEVLGLALGARVEERADTAVVTPIP